MRTILVFLLLVLSASAQDVQVYEVRDFSGGLVNSIANSLMQDNQLVVMDNFDITPLGNLLRRPGFQLHHTDNLLPKTKTAIVSHQTPLDKTHFTIRPYPSAFYYDDDTARRVLPLLLKCDEATAKCTTLVYGGFYNWQRENRMNTSATTAIINNNLVLASKKSEMILYDGNFAFPARPYAPGQPRVSVMDGGGNVTGTVRYRYFYHNSPWTQTSNSSPPSWPVHVKNGRVFLYLLGPRIQASNVQYQIIIYRSVDGGPWWRLGYCTIPAGEAYTEWTDDWAVGTGLDTLTWPWGYRNYCAMASGACSDNPIRSPGSMLISYDGNADNDLGVTEGLRGITDSTCLYFAYSVVFVDSAGRQSYASPASCQYVSTAALAATGGDDIRMLLDSIPVPHDSSIVKKILLRGLVGRYLYGDLKQKIAIHPRTITSSGADFCIVINEDTAFWESGSSNTLELTVDGMVASINNHNRISEAVTAEDSTTYYTIESNTAGVDFSWEVLCITQYDTVRVPNSTNQTYNMNFVIRDTLEPDVKSYIDSLPYDSMTLQLWCRDSTNPQDPESFCYDSMLQLQPSAIESHGSRLYAIGDEGNPNRLYYSDFGRPTTWPGDHFLEVPSDDGDWFVRLLSIANDRLLAFRQNSIIMLSGLSYYQFSLDEIIDGIGLSAFNSLARFANKIYFLHSTGVYEFSRFNTPDDRPVSWLIDKTIDSLSDKIGLSWGGVIDGDYWCSAAIGGNSNNKTYIWSEFPKPHWKCYTLGFNDAIKYDIDTTSQNYSTDKYVFLGSNDTLYRWGYTDTLTWDEPAVAFSAKIKTKAFLEGPGRKKILWFEVLGSGGIANAYLTYWDKKGTDSLRTDMVTLYLDSAVDNRIAVNEIVEDFSVTVDDHNDQYSLAYKIQGIRFGWVPWDEGKKK